MRLWVGTEFEWTTYQDGLPEPELAVVDGRVRWPPLSHLMELLAWDTRPGTARRPDRL